MYLSFLRFQMSKKEKWMRFDQDGFDEFVCLRSNLGNDNIISD